MARSVDVRSDTATKFLPIRRSRGGNFGLGGSDRAEIRRVVLTILVIILTSVVLHGRFSGSAALMMPLMSVASGLQD